MENLEGLNLFQGIYKNKRVLLTGHTGLKGPWIGLWLQKLGATVCGYSLTAETVPNHHSLLDYNIQNEYHDIRDVSKLNLVFNNFKPEIIFHMAAQALVRDSYRNPDYTFETNVLGSLRVFEAAKNCPSVKAIIAITTDKVYENKEWSWGYRENDRLGGNDPYSASKAAMEIMAASFKNSFFNINSYKNEHNILLSTVRAGNVIGGGDWAKDRLIPDIVRAATKNEITNIRNPKSTRPWQHVLDPISGYLLLGQKLLQEEKMFSTPYNFGPVNEHELTVEEVLLKLKTVWNKINYTIETPKEKFHEAGLLKLDCSKAIKELEWLPCWNSHTAFEKTINWYQQYYENNQILTEQQLHEYVQDARKLKLKWAYE